MGSSYAINLATMTPTNPFGYSSYSSLSASEDGSQPNQNKFKYIGYLEFGYSGYYTYKWFNTNIGLTSYASSSSTDSSTYWGNRKLNYFAYPSSGYSYIYRNFNCSNLTTNLKKSMTLAYSFKLQTDVSSSKTAHTLCNIQLSNNSYIRLMYAYMNSQKNIYVYNSYLGQIFRYKTTATTLSTANSYSIVVTYHAYSGYLKFTILDLGSYESTTYTTPTVVCSGGISTLYYASSTSTYSTYNGANWAGGSTYTNTISKIVIGSDNFTNSGTTDYALNAYLTNIILYNGYSYSDNDITASYFYNHALVRPYLLTAKSGDTYTFRKAGSASGTISSLELKTTAEDNVYYNVSNNPSMTSSYYNTTYCPQGKVAVYYSSNNSTTCYSPSTYPSTTYQFCIDGTGTLYPVSGTYIDFKSTNIPMSSDMQTSTYVTVTKYTYTGYQAPKLRYSSTAPRQVNHNAVGVKCVRTEQNSNIYAPYVGFVKIDMRNSNSSYCGYYVGGATNQIISSPCPSVCFPYSTASLAKFYVTIGTAWTSIYPVTWGSTSPTNGGSSSRYLYSYISDNTIASDIFATTTYASSNTTVSTSTKWVNSYSYLLSKYAYTSYPCSSTSTNKTSSMAHYRYYGCPSTATSTAYISGQLISTSKACSCGSSYANITGCGQVCGNSNVGYA